MRILRFSASLACALACVAAPSAARADASAWAFVGGGAIEWKQPPITPSAPATSSTQPSFGLQGTLNFDLGAGTSPDAPIIFGGFFRIMPVLGHGTDLALLARAATHGFQSGLFGIALDAGAYQRFWGDQSTGFIGEVAFGGPLGLELRIMGTKGTNEAVSFGAVAGIDLLRLTLYRSVLTDWWPNPSQQLHEAAVPRGIRF